MKNGFILENQKLKSSVLDRDVLYSIYLPYDYYSQSCRSYPVLYLLHGAGGNHNSWLEFGEIGNVLDRKIGEQEMPPFIVVMPDGRSHDEGDTKSFYINGLGAGANMEDMFIQELMPHIESEYRVKKDRMFQFIGGNSMGGYGALYYGTRYPEKFKAVFSLSGAILNDDILKSMPQKMYDQYFGRMIGTGLTGDGRINERYRQYSIIDRFKKLKEEDQIRYFIDCGDKDDRGRITETNSELHILMAKRGIDHEFRMDGGGHQWKYWRMRIDEALDFISESVRNK